MKKSIFLLILLFIVLAISVFFGYAIQEGFNQTNDTPPTIQTYPALSTITTFAAYQGAPLFKLYEIPNKTSVLYDPTNYNLILTDTLDASSATFTLVDRSGESTTVSGTINSSKAGQSNTHWTYKQEFLSITSVALDTYVYIYIIDQNVSSNNIKLYRIDAAGNPNERIVTELICDSYKALHFEEKVSDAILSNAMKQIGNMSTGELQIAKTPGSAIAATNSYYIIVSIPPTGSTKIVSAIIRNPASNPTLVLKDTIKVPITNVNPTGETNSTGVIPPPSHMILSDPANRILNVVADIAEVYGEKFKSQNRFSDLGPFSANIGNLGQNFNAENSNYILKSEIVPPVCPMCPSCGITGCTLSLNAYGQIVDCCGTVVNTSNNGHATASSNAPASFGSNIAGAISTTATTAGGVANNAITSTANLADTTIGTAGNTLSSATKSVSNAATDIAGTAGGVANTAINQTGNVVNKTVGAVGNTASSLGGDVANIVGGLGQDVSQLGTAAIGATANVANNAIDTTGSIIKSSGASSQVSNQPPNGYGYPNPYYNTTGYSGYEQYPYYGYGGYQQTTCVQQPNYLPLTADFSAFGK